MAQQNKEHQKKLLTEIMEADQKNGLYDHIGDTNKKVTAVEWLQMKMATSSPQEMVENINVWFKEAKQMEKQQLDKAYYKGQESKYIGGLSYCEQYYSETYKSND